MALVIEDGSGVAGANSYISVADARGYATARGLILPVADTDVEPLLIKAMDYIESQRADFQGLKTDEANPLQWPRVGARLDGYEILNDAIPEVLKSAQAQLAFEAQDTDLMPTVTGREVVSEQVDVIKVAYAQTGNTNPQPILTKARALLKPLLKSGLFGSLRSLRV